MGENIYFKFVVNVMWELVPGSTLMKLCPMAPPFETVPSGAKILATILHEGENVFFVKT